MGTPQQQHQHQHVYTINELSTLFDVTPRTLRHYEDLGLLIPLRRGSRRLYRERERVRLQLILRGRRLGFSLADIQEMLDLYDADPTEITQLKEVIKRGDTKLHELFQQVDQLQLLIDEMADLRQRMQERLDHLLTQNGDD